MKRKNITTRMMKGYISDSLLLLMSKKAYADITISEITDKAGVNRSTYYRNFAAKEDIIEFYLSDIMSEYLDEHGKASNRSAENYLRTIFDCFQRHKNGLLLIHKNGLTHLLLSVLNRIFEDELNGESLPELYKRYFHTGGIYNFCILWFSTGMEGTPEEMTKIALSCFPGGNVPMLLAKTP